MTSQADVDVARKTIKLKSSNYCMSFASTLWKGEVIMCCYNNLANEITNVFCAQQLDDSDMGHLKSLIKDKILLDNPI